ncbi:nicotinamide riboside transporter PnuC [Entomomonas moraniae]|uniref:Nicotinamide riboside transporter PnuC n=2 Tax=Entomomonas moraniae TaxID=2213226 RepID=A0A3S9XAU6_9GAMM|nr:nicotinamide riboside transporter PnuC [Entomomonas moraniae]
MVCSQFNYSIRLSYSLIIYYLNHFLLAYCFYFCTLVTMPFSLSFLDTIEYIAIIASLGYVILSSRQLIGTWLFGFIGSALYIIIFFYNGLYGSTLLSCLFTGLMVYGWLTWKRQANEPELLVTQLNTKQRLIAFFIGIALTVLIYCLSVSIEGHAFPIEDASIAGFSLVAQILVARKKLEAWYGWVVINALAVYTYGSNHLPMTALLYVVYTVLAVYGLYKWRTSMQSH